MFACKKPNDKKFRDQFNNSSPQYIVMYHLQISIFLLVAPPNSWCSSLTHSATLSFLILILFLVCYISNEEKSEEWSIFAKWEEK